MKTVIAILLLAGMSLSAGCASVIGIASEEGLKRMPVERRAQYRTALDQADEAIHEAKSQYDARYGLDGEPLPTDPVPAPEDSE